MICYLVQPRDEIFVKGYKFLSFARNMDENVGKNISRNLSSKYSQEPLDHATQSVTDAFNRCFKKSDSKSKRSGWWFNWNKIADKITRVSKTLPKNNPETTKEEIFRERFILSELKQKIINNLRIKEENYWLF